MTVVPNQGPVEVQKRIYDLEQTSEINLKVWAGRRVWVESDKGENKSDEGSEQ